MRSNIAASYPIRIADIEWLRLECPTEDPLAELH